MEAGEIGKVALLHGVWAPAASMWWLAARLREAGFAVTTPAYPSVFGPGEPAVPDLAEQLRGADAVVAHSLGGLMALEALRFAPELPVARLVCLGTPLNGSAVARRLAVHSLPARLLGRSAGLLLRGARPDAGVQTGMIAGTRPQGVGKLLLRLPAPHDGTVSVAETRAAGLADRIELPASHSGLLFSRQAAEQTVHFLRHGRFAHDAAAVA